MLESRAMLVKQVAGGGGGIELTTHQQVCQSPSGHTNSSPLTRLTQRGTGGLRYYKWGTRLRRWQYLV